MPTSMTECISVKPKNLLVEHDWIRYFKVRMFDKSNYKVNCKIHKILLDIKIKSGLLFYKIVIIIRLVFLVLNL